MPALPHAPFQLALHSWYRRHHRRLPWREAPSLYQTIVSEFMLQQTQVATVLPYFGRWMRELPDLAALAAAPQERVLRLWEGLGYYSRARNLHRLAQSLVARATPPQTPAEWRELPGVGPYTAAAICSIALDQPAAVVDGNVVRILARLTNERREFRDGSEAVKFFTPLADALVAGAPPGLHNQAMMELGAIMCVRQNPRCPECPVASLCAARRAGSPEALPRLRPKTIERREIVRLWCFDGTRVLLRRESETARRLAGMHELPDAAALAVGASPGTRLLTKRRAITRFQITENIHRLVPSPALIRRLGTEPNFVWVHVQQLDAVTLSGPHRRWIRELLLQDASSQPARKEKAPPRSKPGQG